MKNPLTTRVALTIDDLPWHLPAEVAHVRCHLGLLLTRLADADVPVTGFVNAGRGHLGELRAWTGQGFALANHTYSHRALSQVSADYFIADIVRNEQAVADALGCDLTGGYFRFPYLDHDPEGGKLAVVTRFIERRGYTLAPVSANTRDYAFAQRDTPPGGRERLISVYQEHVTACVRHFSDLGRRLFGRNVPLVLLLHANELNARKIDTVIRRLRDIGCLFVSLEEALRDPVYQPFRFKPPPVRCYTPGDLFGDIASLRGVPVENAPDSPASFRKVWLQQLLP